MPSLGNLWYTLGIDDKTESQLPKIIRKINDQLSQGNKAIRVNSLEVSKDAATSFIASLEKQIANNAIAARVGSLYIDSAAVASLAQQVNAALSTTTFSLRNFDVSGLKVALAQAVRESVQMAKPGIVDKIREALTSGATKIKIQVDTKAIAKSVSDALTKQNIRLDKVQFNASRVARDIEAALRGKQFKINIAVDKLSIENAVQQALAQHGLKGIGSFTASDARLAAANNAALRAADQHAIAQARLAAMHDKASRAAERHSHYQKAISDQMRTSTQVATILGNAIGNVFSVYAVKSFLTEVVKVGGELEKQRLAMGAIMGDTFQAGEIYKKVANLSMISPFDVEDLVKYSKQLNAFGIKYSELYDTTKRLSDIAAAVGVDFGRIAYEFGQTSARGWLDGRELRMFANSGIPLLQKLSEYYTNMRQEVITAAEVREMITKREVSFDDVKAVLWEMTDAGGEFYQMQEVMAESLAAKWRNLGNAWNLMMGDVAESGMGKGLKRLAEILTTLTENWGTVATVIGLVGAKMAAATLTQNTYNTALAAGTKEALANIEAEQARINLMLASNNGAALAFVRGFSRGLQGLSQSAMSAAVAQGKLTKAQVQELVMTRNMPAFYNSMTKAQKLAYLQTLGFSAAEAKASVTSSVLSARLGMLTGQFIAMTKAMLANPTTWIFAGISGAIMLYERYNNQLRESEERVEKIAEKAKEGFRNLEELQNSTTIKNRPTTEAGYKQAIEEMKTAIKDYAPDWRDIFAEAFGDGAKEGIKNVADQYDYLKAQLDDIKKSYETLNELKAVFEGANKDTGGWLELFDNTALTNLKEANEELSKVNAAILKASTDASQSNKIIDGLAAVNKDYAKWLEENTDASKYAKLTEAIRNYNRETLRIMGHLQQGADWSQMRTAIALADEFGESLNDASADADKLADRIEQILLAMKSDTFNPYDKNNQRALRMAVSVTLDESSINTEELQKQIYERLEKKNLILPLNYVEELDKQNEDNANKPEETKNKTDEQLKAWQERFKRLKEAYQEYKKWFDIYKDDQRAISKTKENPLFADLNVDPSKIRANLEALRDLIQTNTKARRDLQLQVGGEIVNIDYNAIKDAAKKASDAMKEELTEEAKRWDLARRFNEAGVGMDEAVKIAFEADLQVWDRQAREMADRLSAAMFDKGYTLNPNEEFGVSFKMNNVEAEKFFGENGELYQLWKAVKDHIEKNGLDLYSKSAGSIKQFATIEQQITSLQNRMVETLSDAIASGADPQVVEGIRQDFDSKISKLRQELFEGSDVYKELTQDVTNFGVAKLAELRNLAKSIKEAMDAGTTHKDEKGNLIRAFNYGGKDYEATEKAYESVGKLITRLEKKAQSATESFKKMWKWLNGEGEEKLTFKDVAKDIQTVLDSLSETAGQLSQLFGTDSQAGKVAGAVGGSFKGLEQLTDGIDKWMSGDYLGGINGTLQGINTTIEAVMNAMPTDDRIVDALESTRNAFETSFENLSEIMKTQTVDDAYETYKKQQENLAKTEEDRINHFLDVIGKSGSMVTFDGANYHSIRYYIDKYLDDSDWERLASGYGVNKASDLFRMSSEDWYKLMTYDSDIWAKIQNAIKADKHNPAHDDLIGELEAYSEIWKTAKQAEMDWVEYTTGIAFNDVKSAFQSLIGDLSAGWEDFADNFEKVMFDAIVNSMMTEAFGSEYEGRWADYLRKMAEYGSDGTYTQEEVDDLRNDYKGFYEDAMQIREDAKKIAGYDGGSGSKSSLSSAIQGVSAEQVDLLAAYANGMRGDMAVQRLLMEQLVYIKMPEMSINAATQNAHLSAISINTKSIADSNAQILEYVTSVDNRLRAVTDGTSRVYVK